MKHIAITFDDGRSDNYLLAKQIMDKYQLRGTVYVTTGFIDGSWEGKDILQSPTRPLTIEEIKKLYDAGWEIGLHGDCHQTQVDDMRTALHKLQSWGIDNPVWSISVPNSDAQESEISAIIASEYGEKIAYIRRGRKCDTTKLTNKMLYAIYSVFKFKWAYRRFNRENVFICDSFDKVNVPSVVVKSNDTPDLIIDFINSLPDNSLVVLMLHSILESDNALCGKDVWSWGENQFENLCKEIARLQQKGTLNCMPLMDFLIS